MGFFSGILDTVKNVGKGLLGGVGDILGFGRDAFGGLGDLFKDFGPFFSGASSFFGQREANQQNIDLAREQMGFQERMINSQQAFQERMSGSAYRRAMADLAASGLNPMLAYQQGGASSPSGGTAGGALARVESAAGAGVSSALQAEQVRTAIRAQKSQELLNVTLESKANADSMLAYNSAAQIKAREPAIKAQAKADAAEARVKESLFKDPIGSGVMSAGQMIKNFFGPLSSSAAQATGR